jgi:molybdenum cofactor cytidylyltransferase
MQAIILAAGASSRMGSDKAFLPWGGVTVVEHLIALLSTRFDRIIVVAGANHQALSDRLSPLTLVECVHNPDWSRGMITSIRAGFAASHRDDPVLLQMVDQPHVPLSVADALISAWKPGLFAVQPVWRRNREERAGHPLLLSTEIRKDLADPRFETLRDIMSAHRERVLRIPVDERAILEDLDFPADYRAISRRVFGA